MAGVGLAQGERVGGAGLAEERHHAEQQRRLRGQGLAVGVRFLDGPQPEGVPLRLGDTLKLALFDSFFSQPDVQCVPLTTAVFDRATSIRAQHGFKTVDSINLAAAVEKESGGRIKGEVYPASQLGPIPRQIEGAQFGAIQCVINPPEFFVGVDERYEVMTAGMGGSERRAWHTEKGLPVGQQVYVLGYMSEQGGQPVLRCHPRDCDKKFIISYRSEQDLTRATNRRANLFYTLAAVAGVGGILLVGWQVLRYVR